MWSAWLIRTDARANASLDDAEAQREFVVWWLLYGKPEYPAAWWFGPDQIAVAMEPVNIAGRRLPRLVRRIYLDRRDVQAAFPLRDADALGDLLCWYRLSGPVELGVAPALQSEFLCLTEAPSGRSPWAGSPDVPRMAAALHARQPDLQRQFNPAAPATRAALVQWYKTASHRLIPAPTPLPEWAEPAPPPCREAMLPRLMKSPPPPTLTPAAPRPPGGRTRRPCFLTIAMWFAWLLRTDARAGAALDDPEAQREFVVWWLLYGKSEYPAVWWFGQNQIEIAMEAVNIDGHRLPRLVRRIYLDRHDIQAAFPLKDADAAGSLLCWYRLSGPIELPVAPALPAPFLHLTESPSRRSPWAGSPDIPRMAAELHTRQPELQSRFNASTPAARAALVHWYETASHHLIPAPTPLPEWAEPTPPPRPATTARDPRPPGVNLVGFARAEFGIGEDVRSVSGALEAAKFPHVIINLKSMPHVRDRDSSRAHHISSAMPYRMSIFCLTAFSTAGLFLERGPALFAGTFNIGYWPWEFRRFPTMWADAFDLVDEVWAATRFQWHAYQAAERVPVFVMPPAVLTPGNGELRRATPPRRKPRRFRFIFPFDPNSLLSRKNPVAAIRAFRQAFPANDRSVELVLRVNGTPDRSAAWRAVRAAARRETRIVLICGTMDRAASLALLRDADCLISPHRAEGFGRNIAEAIALGVPVLATGKSGPDDFLQRRERIASRPCTVAPNEYPFAEGLLWYDPVVADLARKMRRVRRANASTDPKTANRGRTARHAPLTVGTNYLRRLALSD